MFFRPHGSHWRYHARTEQVWRSDLRPVSPLLCSNQSNDKVVFQPPTVEKWSVPVRFRRVDNFFRTYPSKRAYTILLALGFVLGPYEKRSRPQIPIKGHIFQRQRHSKRLADGPVPAIIGDAICQTFLSCMSRIPSLDAIFRNPTLQRAE